MTDRELMQQALEAMMTIRPYEVVDYDPLEASITALRERLAQPEQEPVAWEDVLGAIARGWTHDDNKHKPMDVQLAVAIAKEIQDMVTAPTQRQPLTDEEIERACVPLGAAMLSFTEVARAIEAAHGIKENT